MAKLKAIEPGQELKEFGYIAADFVFYCPGCKCHHGVWTTNKNQNNAIWSFNGSMEKPTFKPSLLITYTYGDTNQKKICHTFITDGKIQFLNDCTHELAGQTVELPDIESI